MKSVGGRWTIGLVAAALWLGVAPAARAAGMDHNWSKRLGGSYRDYALSVVSDP
ncbi:MAG: hypothetical protein HY775_02080 [Acidobacteria bacterium]|nr:hypothetical protein [Acidobacteriota bacterium]